MRGGSVDDDDETRTDASAGLKHRRLRDHLLNLIDTQLSPHDRLPTERDFAEAFSVSRMTARRALQQLVTEGRVYRVQGAGTFVAEIPITKGDELTSFSEDMRRRGLKPGSVTLTTETVHADSEVSFALGVSPGDPVVHIERVRTANDIPMCIENSYLPCSIVPHLPRDLVSLYGYLTDELKIIPARAHQYLRAAVVSERQAELLHVAPFSAALVVERTTYDNRNRLIERAVSIYRADRYGYEIDVRSRDTHPEA